jgi:hypothetical protein
MLDRKSFSELWKHYALNSCSSEAAAGLLLFTPSTKYIIPDVIDVAKITSGACKMSIIIILGDAKTPTRNSLKIPRRVANKETPGAIAPVNFSHSIAGGVWVKKV